MWYIGVLIGLQLWDTICIYISMWPKVRSVTRSFRSGCTHILALDVNNAWLLPVYSKVKIVLYFRSKHMWGQIFKLVNIYLILYIYLYILLILAGMFRGCSLWWGRVVIPVDLQRVHHFSAAGHVGMMNHVYLQELQSSPSHVASSTHSVLGWVTPLCDILLYNHKTKGFTSLSSLFPCHPLSVKFHRLVIPWSFI